MFRVGLVRISDPWVIWSKRVSTQRQVVPGLYVSPQLMPEQMEFLAQCGIRSVVNNRPEAEAPDQPDGAQIEGAAIRAGLRYLALPVVSGQITQAQVQAFAAAVAELPQPLLAFCRTGTRSITLWALTQASSRPPKQILALAEAAGYDLSGLGESLERAHQPQG